jgi:hypothetical protein
MPRTVVVLADEDGDEFPVVLPCLCSGLEEDDIDISCTSPTT